MDNRAHITLIGDTILDITTRGAAIGLSAETPTVTMRVDERTVTQGGAAFVARNLSALECDYMFLTDSAVGREPVTKERFWADGYKLFQTNTYPDGVMTKSQEDILIAMFDPPRLSLVVFSDYRHGLLTERVIRTLIKKAKDANCLVFVDSQVSKAQSNHGLYYNADVMFVNEREVQYVPDGFDKHGTVVVKMGAAGCRLYGMLGSYRFSGTAVNPVDTCGAGDAFLAAFVAKYGSGLKEALYYANKWAAAKCTLPGMEVPNAKILTG